MADTAKDGLIDYPRQGRFGPIVTVHHIRSPRSRCLLGDSAPDTICDADRPLRLAQQKTGHDR